MPPSGACPNPGAHRVEHGNHIGLCVLAVEHDALAGQVAQRRVQHGAAFGDVDLLAFEHCSAAAFEVGGARKFFQHLHRVGVDSAFRPVEQKIAIGGGEFLEALGIGGEGLAHGA